MFIVCRWKRLIETMYAFIFYLLFDGAMDPLSYVDVGRLNYVSIDKLSLLTIGTMDTSSMDYVEKFRRIM